MQLETSWKTEAAVSRDLLAHATRTAVSGEPFALEVLT